MSTVESTTSVTPPANPAKGNLRGQSTLAAEIERWQVLVENMASQIDQLPGLKEPFEQFQALVNEAKAVRNQISSLKADLGIAFERREQLRLDGGDLYSRLHLSLQGLHGPRSSRLREFGLKPRKPRSGRPRKTAPPPTPAPPPVEVAGTHPPAPRPPVTTTAGAGSGE